MSFERIEGPIYSIVTSQQGAATTLPKNFDPKCMVLGTEKLGNGLEITCPNMDTLENAQTFWKNRQIKSMFVGILGVPLVLFSLKFINKAKFPLEKSFKNFRSDLLSITPTLLSASLLLYNVNECYQSTQQFKIWSINPYDVASEKVNQGKGLIDHLNGSGERTPSELVIMLKSDKKAKYGPYYKEVYTTEQKTELLKDSISWAHARFNQLDPQSNVPKEKREFIDTLYHFGPLSTKRFTDFGIDRDRIPGNLTPKHTTFETTYKNFLDQLKNRKSTIESSASGQKFAIETAKQDKLLIAYSIYSDKKAEMQSKHLSLEKGETAQSQLASYKQEMLAPTALYEAAKLGINAYYAPKLRAVNAWKKRALATEESLTNTAIISTLWEPLKGLYNQAFQMQTEPSALPMNGPAPSAPPMGCPAPSAPPMPKEILMGLPVLEKAIGEGDSIPFAMPADSISTLEGQKFYDTLNKELNP